MPDFSHVRAHSAEEPLNVAINERIERAAAALAELPRGYLGASAVGHECMRQTQYDWWCKPLLPARVRSIFDRGHFFEARTRSSLIAAGFVFAPKEALEFIALDGALQGHADGIIIAAPAMPGVYFQTPCVWEHKATNARNFRAIERDGYEQAFPRYSAQIRLYQRFLDKRNPALVSVVNADTCEVRHFTLLFDAELAERAVERAVEIIEATRRGELLPRAFNDPDDWRCGICSHRTRCWGGDLAVAS